MQRRYLQFLEAIAVPLLAASFPVLALAATNIHEIELADPLRALAVSLLAGVLLYALTWMVVRDRERAALLSAAALLLFFSYGHLREIFKGMPLTAATLGRHRFLTPLAATLLGGWTWLALRRLQSPQRWVRNALLIGLVSLVYPGWIIASRAARSGRASSSGPASVSARAQPDIYYIILDGYGRADILESLYAFDNRAFLEALEARGFYVADEAVSNYNTTRLSLASALNFQYMRPLVASEGLTLDQGSAEQLILDPSIMEALRPIGYQSVAFDSGRPWSSMTNADHYLAVEGDQSLNYALPRTTVLNLFETLLYRTTWLSMLDDSNLLLASFSRSESAARYEEHRVRILYAFQKLPEIPAWPGNYFTFLHVLSPHPPFIFGADGERVDPDMPFTFGDGSNFLELAGREEYIHGYVDQLRYINTLALASVDAILQHSEIQPIIIIQGDHGPGAYLEWGSLDDSNVLERHAILNAYLVPEEMRPDLYPSITPVNTFRIILNHLFQENLALLDDRAYFTEKHGVPVVYELTEISGLID